MQRIMFSIFHIPRHFGHRGAALIAVCFIFCLFSLSTACGGGGTTPDPNVCDSEMFMADGDTCDGTLIFASVGATGSCCPKCCTDGVEGCLPSDYEAFPSEKACKGECEDLLCALDCPDGYAKDEFGCDSCECVETCETGDTKDAGDGCNTCTCTDDGSWTCTEMACICPPDPCPDADMAACEFGFQLDELGCAVCECAPECQPGTQVEKDCNTCDCTNEGLWTCTEKPCPDCPEPREFEGSCIALAIWAQNPDNGACCSYSDPCSAPEDWDVFPSEEQCSEQECPELECDIDCENGLRVDEKGCEICECAPVCDPGETKDAGDDCNECVCTDDGQWACTDEACPEECPEAQEFEGSCDSVIVFARNADSGDCCTYPNPCSAPDDWAIYYDLASCESACQPVLCDIDCPYGFKVDENGCEYCECKEGECSPPGLETPANDGCNQCVCDTQGTFACTKIGCPEACEVGEPMSEGCPDGNVWSRDPETGTCCLYDACNTPVGWTSFEDKDTCQEACPLTQCDIVCENGQKIDENGCELCECNPVCEEGDTKDAGDGCNTCVCDDGNWACTEMACPTCPPANEFDPGEVWCTDGMTYAKNPQTSECCAYDNNCAAPLGWAQYSNEFQCVEGCEPVTCLMFCQYGWKLDENGCEICECNPPPTECEPGESKMVECNTCFCDSEGTWSCTELDCEACAPGDTKEADDGCNTCFCNASQEWLCTEMACPVCEEGETKLADDGCNTCTCEDGFWDCPTGPCPECSAGETKANTGECSENEDFNCTCADGFWACPTCPTCTAGEIQINGCNTRTCGGDGQWQDWSTNSCATCGVPWDAKICEAEQTWGKEPSTGLCCVYPKPCWVPGTYQKFETLEACQAAD